MAAQDVWADLLKSPPRSSPASPRSPLPSRPSTAPAREPPPLVEVRVRTRPGLTAWGRLTDGNPFTTHMNAATKYVVSRTLGDADAWPNSILLRGDAVATVADLKAQSGRDLSIIGSASLVRSLHAAGLIDRYTLLIHPLSLGTGIRLFEGPAPLTEFDLTESVTTTKGVIIARYTRR